MFRRCAALIVLLLLAGEARAHRLDAQAFVLPFHFVRVESWYETGDTPKAARVEVFGPDGRRLADGRMDEQGVFVFPYRGIGPLRIVVNAGAGHAATEIVKTEDLALVSICTAVACLTPTPSPFAAAPLLIEVREPPPVLLPVPHETGPQYGRLLLGVGFLLGVAGVFQAIRKKRAAAVANSRPIH